jgi:hypothetical protein
MAKPTVRNLLDRRFNGYLGIRLPHELDAVVESVVVDHMAATEAARRQTLEAVQPRAAGVLSAYGQRMAAMAVRTDSVVPLYRGVVGMGMADQMLEDPRNNLVVLAAVNHSAETIGTSLARVLTDVRRFLPERAYEKFWSFTERDERGRSLSGMALAAYGSKEDFYYGSGPTNV